MPRMDTNKQQVAVTGGGIAGMAVALALARAGWQPVVFEQAPVFAEVGAGVQLGPNVTRLLRAWGLHEALMASACTPSFLNARRADTGEVLGRLDLQSMTQRYGAPYVSIHRADLHRLLLNAAQAQGVQLRLDHSVQAWQQDATAVRATVKVSSDTGQPIHNEVHAQWGVVADGVWSHSRQTLLGDAPATWTGHLAYRALIAMDDLPPTLHAALRSKDVNVWMARDMHLVSYPVSAGRQLNVVCLVKADWPAGVGDVQSWSLHKTEAQTRTDLQLALRGACAALHQLIDAGHGWRLWPLHGRTPMQGAHEHVQGRIALVGDAAHPMLPYLAQGAGMAIEDAAALAHAVGLHASATPTGISDGLNAFAHNRWQRNARVQQRAMRNGEIFHASGVMRMGRDWGLRALGGAVMDVPWLYGYVSP